MFDLVIPNAWKKFFNVGSKYAFTQTLTIIPTDQEEKARGLAGFVEYPAIEIDYKPPPLPDDLPCVLIGRLSDETWIAISKLLPTGHFWVTDPDEKIAEKKFISSPFLK